LGSSQSHGTWPSAKLRKIAQSAKKRV